MVAATGTVTKTEALVVSANTSGDIYTSAFRGVVLTDLPTVPELSASQYRASFLAVQDSPEADVSQLQAVVVYRIVEDNPLIRVWTFPLDAHDFWVLRIGDSETLVYDTYSDQWSNWADVDTEAWGLSTGRAWIGSKGIADQYGSQIIVGDNTTGALYFLDPEYAFDEDAVDESILVPFTRKVSGQLPSTGRGLTSCYGVSLFGSIGKTDDDSSVTLEYSDNGGVDYTSAGSVTIVSEDYGKRVDWLSLGSFSYPGRLFRITDDGAFARIDGLELLNAGE